MRPKEKAKDLVYKFYPSVQWKLGQEDCLDRAKKSALIAVDEVKWFHQKLFYLTEGSIFDKYLEDVKKEIELL
jgi:hypothetical protein